VWRESAAAQVQILHLQVQTLNWPGEGGSCSLRYGARATGREEGAPDMNLFTKTLTWPIVSLLITGGLHFTLEAARPDLQTFFVPAVLAPILLAYGAWVGYRAIQNGGTYVHAIVAGAILGILPLALDIVGFGAILGRGTDSGITAGIFGLAVVVFGSLIGSGVVLSREGSSAR
jgi:hypothetical protein